MVAQCALILERINVFNSIYELTTLDCGWWEHKRAPQMQYAVQMASIHFGVPLGGSSSPDRIRQSLVPNFLTNWDICIL